MTNHELTIATNARKEIFTTNRLHWAFAFVLLLPVLIWPTVPSQDLPNHAARAYILAHMGDYSHLYQSVFYPPPPYLLIDTLGMILMKFLPIVLAGKLIFALQLLSVPAAFIIFSRLLHRKQSNWEFCGYALAYNTISGFGFANFLIVIALIAVAILALEKTESSPVKQFFVAGAAISIIVLTHLTGLLFFFFFYAIYLSNLVAIGEKKKEEIVKPFLITLVASVPSWLYYKKITSFYVGYTTEYSPLSYKLSIIPNALNFDSSAVWKVCGAVTLILFIVAIARKELRTNPVLIAASLMTLLLFAVSPTSAMSGYNIDVRLFLVVIVVSLAAFTGSKSSFAPIFGAVVAIQSGSLIFSSFTARRQLNDISVAIEQIQPGDLFYTLAGFDVHELRTLSFSPTIMNYPILELAKKQVYDGSVFAIPWQQPMNFREKILKTQPLIQPVDHREDVTANIKAIQETATDSEYVYRKGHTAWLFLTKQPETTAVSSLGQVVAQSDRWMLFRIDKP